jgi:hypothetical protein
VAMWGRWLAVVFSVLVGCQAASEDGVMSPSIQDVKAKHQVELMSQTGVVSVGIGKDGDGNPVIVVGLDRERPDTVQALPEELEGYRVQVEVVGRIKSQD